MADIGYGHENFENFNEFPDLSGTQRKISAVAGEPIAKVISSDSQSPVRPLFQNRGPLKSLETSPFSYQSLRYPLDVEDNAQYGYFIKFNILMAARSQYAEKLSFGDESKAKELRDQQGHILETRFTEGVGAIKNVILGKSNTPTDPNSSQRVQTTALNIPFRRQTISTGQSISLYMPDILTMDLNQNWDSADISATRLGKAGQGLTTITTAIGLGKELLGAATTGGTEAVLDKFNEEMKGKSAAVVGEAIGNLIGSEALGLAVSGYAMNPAFEVLYKAPDLRSFQFDFIFAPRNRKEAEAAIAIIQMFKFHSSPEMAGGTDLGRFYIPPSEFNIEMIGRNGEIWQLGRILPNCVLTTVSVNYGQSGQFAVFDDGTPTNIQMRLEFKETELLTKNRVEEGY